MIAFLVGGGCTGRDRRNPFDPLNADTEGEPAPAKAVAGCAQVDLSWIDLGMTDLTGFQVWRTSPGQALPGSLLTVEPLGAGARGYTDNSVVNGNLYTYQIEFLFDEAAAPTVQVDARPGPAIAWCADPCGWGLRLLSPDARTVRESIGFVRTVLDLDVDAEAHRLFAADLSYPGSVIVRSTDPGGSSEEIPIAGASSVSWSAAAGALAVGAFYQNQVSWVTPEGEIIDQVEFRGSKPHFPEDVSFRDATCTWVALADSQKIDGMLVRVDLVADRVDTIQTAVAWPVAIADDPDAGGCWVADRDGSVLYVGDDLSVRRTEDGTVSAPTDLDRDGNGECWVADRDAGALVLLDRECAVQQTLAGVPGVHGVTVDPHDSTLWVTLPESGEILLLDGGAAAGDTLGLGYVGGCPAKIAGDWTAGCASPRRPGP